MLLYGFNRLRRDRMFRFELVLRHDAFSVTRSLDSVVGCIGRPIVFARRCITGGGTSGLDSMVLPLDARLSDTCSAFVAFQRIKLGV